MRHDPECGDLVRLDGRLADTVKRDESRGPSDHLNSIVIVSPE